MNDFIIIRSQLHRHLVLFCGMLAAGFLSMSARGAEASATPTGDKEKPTFWLLPHTHWEGAVFKTREEYLEMGLPHILTALRLLREYPEYHFTLDQVEYFRAFLERYPEHAAEFRKFVAEGRLQIVGGFNVMPDNNLPSGESFIRQMLYAKGYCRDALGTEVTVGWLIDTFGHNAQLPQLLRLAGYKSFWFSRGVEDRAKMQSEFLWEGLDGTRIPAFWLPFFYGHLYGPPKDLPGFTQFMVQHWEVMTPFSHSGDRVGPAGVDVCEPEIYVPPLVEQFNAGAAKPFRLRFGGPSNFERVVAKRTDLPVIKGERNPLFQGVYSSRIELKQRMRETERLLTTAEKLGAMESWLGGRVDDGTLWKAWEPALFNVTHDLSSGVMTDHVYEDTLRSYDFSQRLGEELNQQRMEGIVDRIDTRGEGIPLVVFNTLGWARTDIAQGDVGFTQGGIKGVELVDNDGRRVPAQILEGEHFEDQGLRRIKFLFVARDLPAFGYAVYHVKPIATANEMDPVSSETDRPSDLENESCRAVIDPRTGVMKSLQLKRGNWEALSGPANVVTCEKDAGDFWELNQNLDGAQNVIVTRPLNVPKGEGVYFSSDTAAKTGKLRRGPVFTELQTEHPFGTNLFATTVRVYQGIPRVDFETRIVNHDQFVRYRLLVPTTVKAARNVQEIPFGAVERPNAQEFPAQNWMDYSDGEHGLLLLNRGLPGNNTAEGTMMLSLLRSTRIQSYGIGGGFEGQGSDSGLELGQTRTYRYGLVPHAGDWKAAHAYRSGLEFNNPLLVTKVAAHAGNLPQGWGFLEISSDNVVLSAVKLAKDGQLVVRLYEAEGKTSTETTLTLRPKILSATEANLMEDRGSGLKVKDNAVRLSLRGFEIKTLKFQVKSPK
jgi:alpha-mannosidase